jgi:Topoisomerase DNA binding C4 zinc finger
MAEFLEAYLKRGFSRIYVIDHYYKEDTGGYQDETTRETVVAFDGKQYVRATASEQRRFAPPGSYDFGVSPAEPITEEEYKRLSAGKDLSDTREAVKYLEDREMRRAQQAEASKKLEALAPNCPKCGRPLAYRHGKYGWFWGCKAYPSCTGTAHFTAEHKQLWEIASSPL